MANRLTVVNDRMEYSFVPPIDDSARRKLLRRIQRQMQRCRNSALQDGRARWINQKLPDGKIKRRFRWIGKPSRNYLALRAQLRNVERKRIVRLRNAEHRLTTAIVKNHALIAIEDTQVKNMTNSAAGTMENPGTRVAQKRGLNRSILTQRWHSVRNQLAYKSKREGRAFVAVPARNTSRTCLTCGDSHHADVVAAENIRRQGIALAGAESPVSGPARTNRRTRKGTKQATGQLPMLLFVATRLF